MGDQHLIHKEDSEKSISNMQNKSEFLNARVPMEGIELLLNRDKVPTDLGRKIDEKQKTNDDSNINNDILSELDDIISESEGSNKFSGDENRKRERMKRRIRKKNSTGFFPQSKFNIPNKSSQKLDKDNKDVEDSLGDSLEDDELDDDELDDDLEEDDEEEESDVPIYEKKWRSPSEMSRDEITSEKMDLLYRYSRLVENGYKSGLNLNIKSQLETLRSEIFNLEKMRNTQRAIRTQRKLLVSFTSGVEYCNKRYSPYKLSLDGWSGEVLENVGDYDEVFEDLHEKYSDSINVAPELRLLAMVGGSGLMFHLSNTLFKSSTPELSDILQRNPDIMAQIQREALNSMAEKNTGDPVFNMMMGGIQEKKRQQAQQPDWNGRPGYSPPRTSSFPQPSNSNENVGVNINQVPRNQGVVNQRVMTGPNDDILNELNMSQNQSTLVSDIEEEPVKRVSTRRKSRKNVNVIDLGS